MRSGIVSVELHACIPILVTQYAPMHQHFAEIIILKGTTYATMLQYEKNAFKHKKRYNVHCHINFSFCFHFYQDLKCLLP